jgi:hypothetical protein
MNRKMNNTFSALSVATVLMTAGLIAATPTPHADPVVVQPQAVERAAVVQVVDASRAAEARAKAIEQASLARAKNIEARAEALAKELEGKKDVGEILGRVAGFTAQVATEAALNAAVEEFTSVDTAEAYVAPPAPVRKPRQNRRSLAMPYFSFATRG